MDGGRRVLDWPLRTPHFRGIRQHRLRPGEDDRHMDHRLKQRSTAAIPRFVEIYTCYDALEAGRIHNLLESHGFLCRVIDLTSGPLPLTIGKFGEKRIAVPHVEVVRAKRLLGAAIHDGYLSASGNFCGAQVDHRSVS